MTDCAFHEDAAAGAQLAAHAMPRHALFLDRDGVVNANHGYVHEPEQVDWIEGIFDLAREASAAGYLLVVATNQAGIARGYYDETTFLRFTDWIHAAFRAQGAPLLATYYCPHHPTEGIGRWRTACACRKPGNAMFVAAIQRYGIDPAASLLVGDAPTDIAAGAAAGIRRGWLVVDGRLPTLGMLEAAFPAAGL